MIKHKIIPKLVVAASTLVAGALLIEGAKTSVDNLWDLQWRWFMVPLIVAYLAVVLLLWLIMRRIQTKRGAVYWFVLMQWVTLGWLSILMIQCLSANPAAAAFWQGVQPLAWISVSMSMLFFTACYVDDTDYPFNVRVWTAIMVCVAIMVYFAGMTGLVESHVPNDAKLQYWGYQSRPGGFQSVAFAWVGIIIGCMMTMLIKAYRRATDERRRRQLRLFIIGIAQYAAIGVIIDLIFYSLNLWQNYLPPMSFLYTTVLSLIVGYGILRHGMFQISPTALAQPILQNLSEAVFGLNRQLTIEFANSGANKIFGRAEESLKGTSIKRLFATKDYQTIKQRLEAEEDNIVLEDLRVHINGKDSILQLYANQIYENKKPVGYILVIQDITELRLKTLELAREKESVERKVRERTRELHDEQARLNASIEELALGFIMVNEKNEIIMHNKALLRILGHKDSILGLEDLSGSFEHLNLLEQCRRIQRTQKQLEIKAVTAGDKILHVFLSPVITRTNQGERVIGAVILLEDITEVKVLERSRDEFFSIASHELRTPLTVIRGNASMALQYYSSALKDEDLNDLVTDIHESSVRLIAIVNDFLDTSRLEQGKIHFELNELPVDKIIESIVYEFKVLANEKKLRINADTKVLGALPHVWADESRIKQVLYNVVGNAVKFTDKGSIDISAVAHQDVVKVTVTDTGRGIPRASHKLLFHKFQQAGDSLLTRDTTRGTGLGLYISKLLIEKMNGSMALESSEEGKGSVFSVTIPVATEARKQARLKATTAPIDTATGLTVEQK